MKTSGKAAFVLAMLGASVAQAHVELESPSAQAGSYYKAALRVTHGCKGSPTIGVTLLIPAGVQGARPMPKPGWTVDTKVEKLAQPYETHGRRVVEDVTQVTWSGGKLANAHFDEFSLLARLPEAAGKLYFKVIQICEQGRNEWVQIPEAGKSAHDYPLPAAVLEVIPAAHRHSH